MSTFQISNLSSCGDEYTLSCYVGFNTTFSISFLPLEFNFHIILCHFQGSRFWSLPTADANLKLGKCNSDRTCKTLISDILSNSINVNIAFEKRKLISLKLVDENLTTETSYLMKNEESVNELKVGFHNTELRIANKINLLEKKLEVLASNKLERKDSFIQIEIGEPNQQNKNEIDINEDPDQEAASQQPLNNPIIIAQENQRESVNLLSQRNSTCFYNRKMNSDVINLELNEDIVAIEYNSKGEKYLEENNAKRALYFFEQAISKNPNFQEAYINKADALDMLGEYKKALRTIEKAISLSSQSSASHNVKGAILRNLIRYEEALIEFSTAISLNDSDIGYHINKINCLTDLGRKDQCLEYSSLVLCKFDESKDMGKASLYIPLIEINYERENYKDAFFYCERALEINPNDIEIKKYYNKLYYELHKRI